MRNRSMMTLIAAPVLAGGLVMAAMNFPDAPKAPAQAPAGKATVVLGGRMLLGNAGYLRAHEGRDKNNRWIRRRKADTARYEIVETGRTGHAESVEVVYDPSKISYGDLLKVYFSVAHDPTTLDRQHYDTGTQYRSSIFYTTDEQKTVAEKYIAQLNAAHVFKDPIVTKVVPLQGFYAAEDYHQHYLDQVVSCETNARLACNELNSGYIKGLDIPLLNDFMKNYPELYVKESR